MGVLGESTQTAAVETRVSTDTQTFVKDSQGELTVSFTSAGAHPVAKVINPSSSPKLVKISLQPGSDSTLLFQTIDLTAGSNGTFRLYDHSTQPFNASYRLELRPYQSVNLTLQVASDSPAASYGTFVMRIGEI